LLATRLRWRQPTIGFPRNTALSRLAVGDIGMTDIRTDENAEWKGSSRPDLRMAAPQQVVTNVADATKLGMKTIDTGYWEMLI
jgi:hypothetical protein